MKRTRQTFRKDFPVGGDDYVRLEISYCPPTRKTIIEIEGNYHCCYKDCYEGVELHLSTVSKKALGYKPINGNAEIDVPTNLCHYYYCLERLSRCNVNKLKKWFSVVESLSDDAMKQLADKGYCRNEADKVFEKINEVAAQR